METDPTFPHFETLDISMQTYARFCRTHFTSVRKVIIKAMLETKTTGWWVAKSKPMSNKRLIWNSRRLNHWQASRHRRQARRHFS
jgi:hypothetical protein